MVQTSPADRPGTADRRTEILRRAAAVFREKGYHGAGMREIAEGLGLAPGALYYYFESKDDLLYACQEISLDRLIAGAEAIAQAPGGAPAKLARLVRAHLDLTLDELGGSAAHVEFHALPPERLAEIVRRRDAYEALLRGVIAEGVAAGAFRPVDEKLTVMALLGALNWTVVWWDPEGPLGSRDLMASFVDLFVEGLRVDGCRENGS